MGIFLPRPCTAAFPWNDEPVGEQSLVESLCEHCQGSEINLPVKCYLCGQRFGVLQDTLGFDCV